MTLNLLRKYRSEPLSANRNIKFPKLCLNNKIIINIVNWDEMSVYAIANCCFNGGEIWYKDRKFWKLYVNYIKLSLKISIGVNMKFYKEGFFV